MEARAGIRVQIVLALGTLMLLAFVPLGFAVSSLARASELVGRRQALIGVAHAVAVHAREDTSRPLEETLAAHLGELDIDALAVVKNGVTVASAGATLVPGDFGAPGTTKSSASGLVASAESGGVVVVARAPFSQSGSAPLVRLVALYVSLFAVTLLIFMYFTLTRVLVRPLEALVTATGKVARGSRALALPKRGPRELDDVAASVESMAKALLADEAAMRAKVEELTQTTKRLTEAQAQIVRSERMASVGRLAAGVAHEIGNPIAAILGMEDLLLDGGLPPDESRDFLVRMKRETERINTILRDLLDFARPEESPESSGRFQPADVRQTIDEVVALAKPQKAFRDVAIEVSAEPGLSVMLPPARLTQVLLNLTMNAGFAMSRAQTKDARITLRAKRDGDRIVIEVEDEGPGVPEEMREQIFEPFVTTKDVGEGTGLGLSVCRGLVEAAHGTIELDASFESGARFVVTLPAMR